MREFPSLIGKRFGKLTVVEQLPSTARGQRKWLCKCDCGGEHIATSGYRGIYYESKFDRYRAQIIFQRKRYYLGTYKNIEDAIKARQRAEEDFFGAFLERIEQAK